MNNADFSELLSSVGGLPTLKTMEAAEVSRKGHQFGLPATPHTIASESTPSQAEEHSPSSNSEMEGRVTPLMTVTPASEDLTETSKQLVETNKAQKARLAETESVLGKLREAIRATKDKGAQRLQVDIDLVDAVIEHIESRDTAFVQLKSKADGMNVSAGLIRHTL